MSGAESPVEAAVIDASIGLKWVLREAGSEEALALRDAVVASGAPAYVPDLFWAEVANVLWRLTRGAEATIRSRQALGLLEAIRSAPLTTVPVEAVSMRALEIACIAGITAYDAAYVAVAELYGARLWTADRRLVWALARTEWEGVAEGLG